MWYPCRPYNLNFWRSFVGRGAGALLVLSPFCYWGNFVGREAKALCFCLRLGNFCGEGSWGTGYCRLSWDYEYRQPIGLALFAPCRSSARRLNVSSASIFFVCYSLLVCIISRRSRVLDTSMTLYKKEVCLGIWALDTVTHHFDQQSV